MNSPKTFVSAFLAGLASLGLGAEAAYRYWLYASASANPTPIVTLSTPLVETDYRKDGNVYGPYTPNRDFTLRMYGPTGTLNRTIHVDINNLGWVSRFDYTPKQPGEFRIIVIGDSLTASINNDNPWPDVVHSILSADQDLMREIGAKSISVFNLGAPGSSFEAYRTILAPKARRLGADLLVMNFSPESATLDAPGPVRPIRRLSLNGIDIRLMCVSPFPIYEDCRPSTAWNVTSDEPLSPEQVLKTQQDGAQSMRARRLLTYPIPLLFTGQDVTKGPNIMPTMVAAVRDRPTIFKEAREGFPRSVAILNPLLWHFDSPGPVDKFLVGMKDEGVDLIDARTFLPEADGKERATWYNMPIDGHWSNTGAEVYGRVVANIIRRELKSAKLTAPTKTLP